MPVIVRPGEVVNTDPKTPSWLQMIFGTNPEADMQVDPPALLELGIVGLTLYAGYKITKGLVERVTR